MLYMPGFFGEDLMDRWMNDMDRQFALIEKPLYGHHAKNLMKTDVREHEDGYEVEVELPGFHTDVTPFYERSDVYLCTSQYEGAPLTLLEAQCHGLPVVSYEMPWLSVFAHHLGSVTAPQEDKDGTAAALIRLFRDPEAMLRLSAEARRNVDTYFDIDMQAQWRQVLAMAEQPAEPPAEDSEGALMVRTWNQLLQAQKKAKPGNAAERAGGAETFAPVPLRGPFKMARKKIVTFVRVLLIDGFRGVRDLMEDKKHRR